ncbi:MAG: NAD(P)-dependent oxidoreductase [Mesorhizobium sp.]|nr:NAD(P)-dependent oxidoreductase [Mesorhizobium sp.]
MTVLVTGGTGFVGRFIVERLARAGRAVTVMGRTPPPAGFFTHPVGFVAGSLDPAADHTSALQGIDHLVHAAFDHRPGRYRGGEGDDPVAFRRRNRDGSIALFDAARRAGVTRAVFLSSRAVYGLQKPGAILHETTEPLPDTLYGGVKLSAERALHALSDARFTGVSLRVTGVYGPAAPGRAHKWTGLFSDYLAGRPVAPRVAAEVHGDDVAAAVQLALDCQDPPEDGLLNVSDLVLDRRGLLAIVRDATGCPHPLPDAADASTLNVMATDRLRALGWRPGGHALLERTVRALLGAEPAG